LNYHIDAVKSIFLYLYVAIRFHQKNLINLLFFFSLKQGFWGWGCWRRSFHFL